MNFKCNFDGFAQIDDLLKLCGRYVFVARLISVGSLRRAEQKTWFALQCIYQLNLLENRLVGCYSFPALENNENWLLRQLWPIQTKQKKTYAKLWERNILFNTGVFRHNIHHIKIVIPNWYGFSSARLFHYRLAFHRI